MTDLTDKIAKLPKWAQEHIQNLERANEMARRHIDKFEKEQPKSECWYDDLVSEKPKGGPVSRRTYLPKWTHPEILSNKVYMRAMPMDHGVRVQFGNFKDEVVMRPVASNVIDFILRKASD